MNPTRFVVALGAVALLATLGQPAMAQSEEAAERRLAINAGLLFPFGGTENNLSFIIGAQYTFPRITGADSRAQFMLTADWTQVESTLVDPVTLATNTRWVSIVPVLLNYKHWFGGGEGPWYAVGGLGISWARKTIPEMDYSSDINFAWQLMVGREMGAGWFGEARFLASDNPSEDGMLGLQIGRRF